MVENNSNYISLSGKICKIYPLIITPMKIKVSRFTLEHHSQQDEAGKLRLVKCKMFCLFMANEIDDKWLDKQVIVNGFLACNSRQQLVLHIKNINILDKGI